MEKVSMNKAFGDAMIKLGKKHRNLVVLSADFRDSLGLGEYWRLFKHRYFNFGLAEANMVSAAIGFVAGGKNPVIAAYGSSFGKAYDQIKSIAFANLNVKIVGGNAGLMGGQDGPGYQALNDVAMMRALPNMKVVCPADYYEAMDAFEKSFLEYGPVYIRLPGGELPFVYDESCDFEFGEAEIMRGLIGEPAVCVFVAGALLANCLKMADLLAVEGIQVMVVNVASVEPIDEILVKECAGRVKVCVSVEDHSVVGGLGDAVLGVLGSDFGVKFEKIGMNGFGESGKPEDLYRKYKLDVYGLCERVKGLL